MRAIESRAVEIASILQRDCGIEGGIQYAEETAASRAEERQNYLLAADLLRAHRLRLKAAKLTGKVPGWTDGLV